jgi:hypothetical protein
MLRTSSPTPIDNMALTARYPDKPTTAALIAADRSA